MPLPLTVLSRSLQDITETLASATTEEAVFDVILYPAINALSATAATVLLSAGRGKDLHIAASIGQEVGAASIWQNALIDDDGPAADALSRQTPLFFEQDRDLARAYPNVEARTAATAPVAATAVLPMFLDGQPLGSLVLDFQEPHHFSPDEQWFLRVLATQCAIAFGRARLLRTLEAQVLARTDAYLVERTKLRLANEELDAFVASVSHDLRAPVRYISSFSDLLRKSLQGHLDDKSDRYLRLIQESAADMHTLIDAMLELSRTSTLPFQLTAVDLNRLLQRARDHLQPDLTGRSIRWDVHPLPTVMGDQKTLQQVITNLLSNAVKYSRNEDVAHIRVWAQEDEQMWTIFVQDNGVGFNDQYVGKLFGVFQRLHSAREFEGTGIGLANVQRIVQRHGGKVSAEGTVGTGATFAFTLPKTPSERSDEPVG